MLAPLTGCHTGVRVQANARSEQQALVATRREQMEMIPPPSKNRFLAIRSLDAWQNPYLIVQAGMLELHVTVGDANTSPMGLGGMLRPVGARRQELNIDLNNLGEAVASIPQSAWPYGRVIAIAEATKTPASMLPTVRRNLELAIGTLSDLGVVAYDPTEGNLR